MKLDFVLTELIYLTNDFWLKYNSLAEVIDLIIQFKWIFWPTPFALSL